MTPEAMRVAIQREVKWIHGRPFDPLHDLNACAEMRKCVPEGKRTMYTLILCEVCGNAPQALWNWTNATAPQHCETFLRVMGKWVEK